MIFYLVIFVILLISYYIYKNYCKENLENCVTESPFADSPVVIGSCDLTNFSESPHSGTGEKPLGDYQVYEKGCGAKEYAVQEEDEKINKADFVIYNETTFEALEAEVSTFYKTLKL